MAITVLIADDQAMVRGGLRALLATDEQMELVGEAHDGGMAIALAASLQPEVILMDLRMPGMNGFQMLRTLRKLHELSDMKIVVVSGLSPDEIEDGGGIPEGIQVLPKPIPFDQLQEIAERVAASRHSPKIKVK